MAVVTLMHSLVAIMQLLDDINTVWSFSVNCSRKWNDKKIM